MFDLCNQFVVQAVDGGLLALVAYIAIFSRSFGAIGTARKKCREIAAGANGFSGAWVPPCFLLS